MSKKKPIAKRKEEKEEPKEKKKIKIEELDADAESAELSQISEKEEIETEEEALKRSLKDEDEIKKKKKELEELIVSIEDYLRCGIYIGTKTIMPGMKRYIYKKRADGLGILNTKLIDEKIKAASEVISQYAPEEIIIVCKREAGWKALEQLSELTGIRCFLKKYPAGIITNIALPDFFEPSIVLVADTWLDKNALFDAVKKGIPVIGLCDTNNLTRYLDLVVPCNNKSDKSLGLIFWILCREYMKKRKLEGKLPELEAFTGPLEPAESIAISALNGSA